MYVKDLSKIKNNKNKNKKKKKKKKKKTILINNRKFNVIKNKK